MGMSRGPGSAPHPTHRKGEVAEKEVCPVRLLQLQQSHFLCCWWRESLILALAARAALGTWRDR